MDNNVKTKINDNLTLIQNITGLTFGTDAYLLSALVKPYSRARAVDLGSGTGVIPMLCMANGKVSQFFAVEVQKPFADIIKENASINNFDGKIVPICADLRDINPDIFGGEVDIVTANPLI